MAADERRGPPAEIKKSATRTYQLLFQAYEGRAHKALGYGSWDDYVETEFDIGGSQAYRQIHLAKVVRALEAAEVSPAGDIEDVVSERFARDVVPFLDGFVKNVKSRVADGD